MLRFVPTAIALGLSFAQASLAQQEDAVFASYDAMRAEMDQAIRERRIEDLMIRFGGADEMTVEQLRSLDRQVEQLFPDDFENVALLRREQHNNGFAQEIIAYWTGTSYLYAYVFYHNTGRDTVSINFRFNTDFTKLNSLF